MKSVAPFLAGFALAAERKRLLRRGRRAQEGIDLWALETFGRALKSFLPCLVVMLVGLALLSEATATLFAP